MTEQSLIQGVNSVFIGVSDPQAHIDFYCGQLGWAVSETGVLSADEAASIWGDGVGQTEVTVLSAAGLTHGRIILLTVEKSGPAEYPHTSDLGLAGIDIYTRDIRQTHRVLSSAGYTWVTPPATWEIPVGERVVSVTQGFCNAPDGTALVFVENAAPRGVAAWEVEPDRAYTELTSVVCHVPDFSAELAFWGEDGLGLGTWYDISFTSPGLDEMASLPKGTVMRLAFLAGPKTARIEVTQIQDRTTGLDRRGQQRTARDFGHTGWLVQAADLDEVIRRGIAQGGVVQSGLTVGPSLLFGSSRVAMINTPNGISVTIQEIS